MTNGIRKCKICGKELPIASFYGKIYTCKRCICKRNTEAAKARNLANNPDYPNEEWKDVVGFEGIYKISNFGRIRSVGYGGKSGKILAQHPLKDGYLRIKLTKNGKCYSFLVHRLVAQAWISNPKGYKTVNHKDFNTQNNRVENLEWMSQWQNNEYSRRAGHYHYSEKAREAARNNRKISDEIAKLIYADFQSGLKQSELAAKYNVTRAFVCRLVHGRCRTEITNLKLEKDLKLKVSDDDIISINREFRSGISLKELGGKYGISPIYVRTLVFGKTVRSKKLAERGLIEIPPRELSQKEMFKEQICELHSQGMSSSDIAKKLGIKGHGVVSSIIKELKKSL